MDNLIRKKIVLSLLDNDSKSANEIANEIGESLPTVEEQLTTLVLENICEKVNQDAVDHYVVKNDIKTFTQLVKEFLSDKEEHKEQIKQFITSDYYFNRINDELVDYVLDRFYVDSVYHTDEEKLVIKRILLVSPSALFFALHSNTAIFNEMRLGQEHLDSSDETREWLTQILNSQFITPLLKNLIADIQIPAYYILYVKLGVRVALVNTQVKLATLNESFVEAVGKEYFSLFRATEDIQTGQLLSTINPMVFSDNGIALMHLEEFQDAHEHFDKALVAVQDPIEKAKVLNNKGLAFLRSKQYQKAIEPTLRTCFDTFWYFYDKPASRKDSHRIGEIWSCELRFYFPLVFFLVHLKLLTQCRNHAGLRNKYRNRKSEVRSIGLNVLTKVLQKPDPIVIEQIAQHLGSIGAIHQTQPELNPG